VLLLNDEEWRATDTLPMPLTDPRQRYVPGRVDFTAEREWRISMWAPDLPDGLQPWWPIRPAVAGIIVGLPGWLPQPDSVHNVDNGQIQPRFAVALHGLPRWCWNGTALVADGYCDLNTQAR
jgi:hypothetical protein